ncbi:NADH-quinone oxidoreductase subunit N, partial [Mesorhizobium sp. USDA-HM6]
MTAAALFQSILASLPEIVVITGACILLILGQFVRKGQQYFLVWTSVAIVLIAALGTIMLAGEVRPAYSGMFIADRFAVFFKVVFYLVAVLTFLLSRKYAEIERIGSSEYYVLLL